MAKKELWNDISEQLDDLLGYTPDLEKAIVKGQIEVAKLGKYQRTIANFEKVQKAADQHVASYKKGWSQWKGRLDPKLKKDRAEFVRRVQITGDAAKRFRSLLDEIEDWQ